MRNTSITRATKETSIQVSLNLDGRGIYQNQTGIGFFDHMLDGFAKQTMFDLSVTAQGDLQVDQHHTVEDTGICLGKALKQALGDGRGIVRYGSSILPMDDALMLVSLDLSGRGFLGFDVPMPTEKVGDFDTELVKEFFLGLVRGGELTLHIRKLAGENTHHIIECIFKAFGRALDEACRINAARADEIPSTKGSL
ncbi:MAG: imidazoleglycerol-phosphate dehydratase HisB [Firmicutes bacterium]|nr:imidazoleglycerol-phosphate dehydratase HisB [Bacillota bacterium]